jgi:8-oxo-dGTP diphosphatase
MRSAGPLHSVSIAAIIVDEQQRVLMAHRRDNAHWEPPGGVLEPQEAIEDGLRREVAEETGLIVTIDALTGVYKNIRRGIVALVFRCQRSAGDLVLSTETDDFRWATRDEITKFMTPAYGIRALDALDYNGHVAIRTHDGINLIDALGVDRTPVRQS